MFDGHGIPADCRPGPRCDLIQTRTNKFKLDWVGLSLVGVGVVLLRWQISAATSVKELSSPLKTWEGSQPDITEPFAKCRQMDQGILRFPPLVAKGYARVSLGSVRP